MGVHGLWELLTPVGRRVSVDTLAGKRLAIDASIWMVQFMKAMRDEKGDMVRNAHVLGFFRRICKLLFLRTKPVFVFDGATPELKRRTVAARRRNRDAAQAKVRKTAEKLLLNHLKAMRLQEIADNIKNQRKEQKSGAKGKKKASPPNSSSLIGNISEKDAVRSDNRNQEKLDEMLAASIMVEEEDGSLANTLVENEEDDDEDEEMILPDISGAVDPTVLSALTPSLRLDLLQKEKLKSHAKGKKIQPDNVERNIEMGEAGLSSSNQRRLDEMLAASLMEEEKRGFSNNASTSSAPKLVEEDGNMDANDEEDEDEDEEMIVPPMDGEVDPSILASLPPSMQLDLLVQIRERLMAENRQKYQKVKKNPEKFSELQIQSYLKTVAFRREINQVQKGASGRGVAGVQTSRIASESNREFIFSSSFSGNKQELTSGSKKECGNKQQISGEQSSIAIPIVASTSKSKTVISSEEHATTQSNTVTESELDGSRTGFDESIETYVDEQGRVRVSRVRAMGIRMSRDLQRNLELMKEIEEENVDVDQSKSNSAVPTSSLSNVKPSNGEENSVINCDTSIEISFGDDGDTTKFFGGDDDIFTRLVSENPDGPDSDNITPLVNNLSAGSDSDCDWEEGTIEANPNTLVNLSDGSEVEWEEVNCEYSEQITPPLVPEKSKRNSKGHLEEEADLEEAIRRSLGDKEELESEYEMPENDESELPVSNVYESSAIPESKHRTEEPIFRGDDGIQENISITEILDGVGPGFSKTSESPERPLKQSMACDPDETTASLVSSPNQMIQHASNSGNLFEESPHVESQPEQFCSMGSNTTPALPFTEEEMAEFIHEIDNEQKLSAIQNESISFPEVEHVQENSSLEVDENWHVEAMEANLKEEMKILDEERLVLGDERRQLERNAESVSGEMFIDCQELLQMFGIPYIISPTEAESQCAFLEIANIVDGVVTDDSDAFLFGAQSVYKNIFDDRKYVETYFMKDIESELGLSREKLISMALLLGSDYTEGVSGIGIVNAIEVLNAFPEESGLKEFRDWIESPDPTILGKHDDDQFDSKARRKGSNAGNTTEMSSFPENSAEDQEQTQSADEIHKRKKTFMDKHRKVSKNWHVPTSFPSQTVISAYLSPQIDKSTDGFSWGKPDHFLLRKLCWEKFGWDSHKADELILPVLKEYNKRETQLRLEAFYTFNEPFAKFRSKRIKKAVKGITGKKSLKLDNPVPEVSGKKEKRKSKQTESGDDPSENVTEHAKKSTAKNPRKRTKLGADLSESPNLNKRSQPSRRGRGRGKGKGIPTREVSETSEEELSLETPKEHVDLRRSGRARNSVNYATNDMETDDLNRSVDPGVDKETFIASELGQQHEEHNNITDSVPPKPSFETDHHLEKGGGFCVDGSDNNNDDPPEAGEEYLRFGGGFCVGKDETNPDENAPVEEATPLAEENAEPSSDPPGPGTVDRSEASSLLPENDGQTILVGALRSMPHLRKKRRKG